jgi:maltose alpha-D-glucosyltransferase/alpha-amylase
VRAPAVLALEYQWRGTSVLCVHNFDAEPHEVSIRTEAPGSDRLVSLTEDEDSAAARDGTHRLALDPYAYRWYRAETPSSKSRHTRS